MKITSALDSHSGTRLLGMGVLVSLALGIALALLMVPGYVAADGQDGFTAPIALEEGRTPPEVTEPPRRPAPPQARTVVEPPRVTAPPQVRKVVDPPRVLRDVTTRDVTGQQETSVVLVGNNEEADATGNLGFNRDRGQPFTTGNNSQGYRLTKVQIASDTTLATVGNYSVSIASAGSSGPGSTLTGGGLNEPAGLTTGIDNDFTAPGNGIDLDANTTYYIFIDLSAQNSNVFWKSTASNDENANPAAGWSVGNASYSRMVGSTTTTWTQLGSNKMKIKVFGYAKVVPALTSAEINGASLALNFDRDLDTTSVPAAGRFTIAAVGNTHTATGITVSTRQVRLTVPAVKAGQFVTVSYSKPGSNPLKGTNGVDVAAFSGQVVDNKTPAPPPKSPDSPQDTTRTTVRAPITYTEDGETREVTVFSADRDTLYSYFVSECTHQRSVPSALRDYSWFNADGHRMAARNGWKWVEVQNANGEVTHTRPMTISECASLKMYHRQAFCAQYADDQGPNEQKICPTNRTW